MNDISVIATYYLQYLNVSSANYTDGSVKVKCVFLEGSIAEGCHIVFNDTTQGLMESFDITGSGEMLLRISESGSYTLTAYDIVNGSIVGPAVLYAPVLIIVIPSVPISAYASTACKYSAMH